MVPRYQILDLLKFMPLCLTEPEQDTRSWIRWNSCQCVWLSRNKIPYPGSGEFHASVSDWALPRYLILDPVKFMPAYLTAPCQNARSWIRWNSCQWVWLHLSKIPDPGSGEIHASVSHWALPNYQILDQVTFLLVFFTEPHQNTTSWIWWNPCQWVWLSLNNIPDRTKGHAFLNSCKLYQTSAPHQFTDNNAKIMWAFLFMKHDRAAPFVDRQMWSYQTIGSLSYLTWQDFVASSSLNSVQKMRFKPHEQNLKPLNTSGGQGPSMSTLMTFMKLLNEHGISKELTLSWNFVKG